MPGDPSDRLSIIIITAITYLVIYRSVCAPNGNILLTCPQDSRADLGFRYSIATAMRSFAFALAATIVAADCPAYDSYSSQSHDPVSSGKNQLAFQRPSDDCKTYKVDAVESTITDVKAKIQDPDLSRLFENSWPNTVDTTVLWRGSSADNSDEEVSEDAYTRT